MSIIALPDNNFRRAEWTLVQPSQINRSEWTGARQVMQLPGAARWSVTADHVPIRGESGIRPWRSFFAQMRGQARRFMMPATEGPQTAFSYPSIGPSLALTNAGGVSIVGQTITKTDGTTAWDSSANTSGAGGFTGGARLSFRASDISIGTYMMGLNGDPTTDLNFTGIDYAFWPRVNGTIEIYESGVARGVFGDGLIPDDILSIVYDNATVRYYRNGDLLRSVTTTAGRTFFADSSFYNTAAVASDVTFSGPASLYTGGAGARTIALEWPFPTAQAVLKAGWMATALLYGGGAQLVTIIKDGYLDGSDIVVASFEPMLRGMPFAFITGNPFGLMALDDPAITYSVDPGQFYNFSLTATEAY